MKNKTEHGMFIHNKTVVDLSLRTALCAVDIDFDEINDIMARYWNSDTHRETAFKADELISKAFGGKDTPLYVMKLSIYLRLIARHFLKSRGYDDKALKTNLDIIMQTAADDFPFPEGADAGSPA